MNGENPSTGHSMMSLGDAVVSRDEEGKILPEESYILIQDQRAGFYDAVDGDGHLTQTSGRLIWKATFRYLFDAGYMPVSTLELQGKAPWKKPFCTLENGILTSNYAMAVVKYVAKNTLGRETCLSHFEFSRREVGDGTAFRYEVDALRKKAEEKYCPASDGALRLVVIQASGARFVFE